MNLVVALAPVIMPNGKLLPFKIGSYFEKPLYALGTFIGLWELCGKNWFHFIKKLRVLVPGFVSTEISQFTEWNDEEQTKKFLGHFPHGASLR